MTNVENKRPRGRPPAFDRDVVLSRAMEVFWRHGVDGASVPALTQAMGISAQSLYAAFGSKDELYREAIELYQRTNGAFVAKALADEGDVIAGLKRVLREAALVYTSLPGCGCMITMAPAGQGEEPLIKFGRELRVGGRDVLEKHLQQGVAKGQLKPGTDCATWARYVANTLYGFSVQARDGASGDTLLEVADLSAQQLDTLRA